MIRRVRVVVAFSLMAALCGAMLTAETASATRAVRGFDGTTITVAGIGIKGQLPLTEVGARARIQRFNDTKEITGIKLRYAEMADDRQDPATALSESRRLVAQVGVFAIVGDTSANNPGPYFAQQHVPYFGGSFDSTYCSPKPSTAVWGFGIYGCLGGEDPTYVGDAAGVPYRYVTAQAHKKHPTIVIFTTDTATGKRNSTQAAVAYRGAGFDVVAVQQSIPVPSPSDYTPYAEQVLTADHGRPPDSMLCQATLDCIGMWNLVHASGYHGVFLSGLYSTALTKLMAGTVATAPYVNPEQDNAGYRQMKADLEKVKPGSSSTIDVGVIVGYTSTDMFIQALKTVAKKGKSNITPENVQQAAANQTWRLTGITGPTVYPRSTVYGFPTCRSLFASNGTTWPIVVPYTCSTKTYSTKSR